ncbi:hypothetical protein BC332_23986 [Capsicum chinense]|nr:hypothetical protein BC332_23986 [Capsicum chinense]
MKRKRKKEFGCLGMGRVSRHLAGVAELVLGCCYRVNPHLFLQVVMEPSEKYFSTDAHSDPAEFMLWFLKAFHADLQGSKNNINMIQQLLFLLLILTSLAVERQESCYLAVQNVVLVVKKEAIFVP